MHVEPGESAVRTEARAGSRQGRTFGRLRCLDAIRVNGLELKGRNGQAVRAAGTAARGQRGSATGWLVRYRTIAEGR